MLKGKKKLHLKTQKFERFFKKNFNVLMIHIFHEDNAFNFNETFNYNAVVDY